MSELVDRVELSGSRHKADELEALGAELQPGEYGRSTFYSTAAEHRLMNDEYDAAERDLRLGGYGHPGEQVLHPLTTCLDWAQRSERPDEVERILAELLQTWRTDELHVSSAHMVGELLELADDLKRAHRWFTMPLSRLDPDEHFEWDEELCIVGRHRVRRALELPIDKYDAVAVEIMQGQAT